MTGAVRGRAILRIGGFLLALCLLLSGLSPVFMYKYGLSRLLPFVRTAKEYDVLLLGDSQMMDAVYPLQLWRDYGITAYNAASPTITMPVCYWMMMNALERMTPRAVVLAIRDVSGEPKHTYTSEELHTALDAWPLTRTKLRTIWDLTDEPGARDDEGRRFRDLRLEYVFPLAKYHVRWNQLTANDFFPAMNTQKGAEMAVGVAVPDGYPTVGEDEMLPEEGAGYAYLRRIIEECARREIPLLLVHMPYPANEQEQRGVNRIRAIAEEYGTDLVDFVRDGCVTDPETDMHDTDAHVNPSGGRKVTDFLGAYLREHYGLADHRGEAGGAAWDAQTAAHREEMLSQLRAQKQGKSALMLLHDPEISLCLSLRAGTELRTSRVYHLLQNIAREHVFEEDAGVLWSGEMAPLSELDYAEDWQAAYFLVVDRETGEICELAGEEEETLETSFGRLICRTGDDPEILLEREGESRRFFTEEDDGDLSILVIDRRTGEPAAELHYDL